MSNYGKGCFNITPAGNVRYRFKYTDMFGNRRVKSVTGVDEAHCLQRANEFLKSLRTKYDLTIPELLIPDAEQDLKMNHIGPQGYRSRMNNIDIISDYLDDVEIKYDSVRNGLDAYNRIKQNHSYDCVLMDIKMPVMDGYEATRKIRALDDEYVRKLPIIAMTANAFAEDVQKSKEAGMNDHITKPVNLELFYSVIKKHMIGEE